MTDGAAGRPVGSTQGDYVWDGAQWVPRRDGTGNTFDGRHWNRPPQPPLPPAGVGIPLFADPRYAYGLTRQTSDDLQFIARVVKIVLVVWLVLLGVSVIFGAIFMGSVLAFLSGLSSMIPR